MNHKGIVSLTYDGGQLCHLETVAPQLNEVGFKATFYPDPVSMLSDLKAWRLQSIEGHEIGNGSLLSAALPDGSLPAFTPQMLLEDAEECETLLREVFPDQGPASLALPWGADRCADGQSYHWLLAQRFPVIRSGNHGVNRLGQAMSASLLSVPVVGMSGSEMIDLVRLALHGDSWLILCFSGVGVGDVSIDAKAHAQMLSFLEASRSMVDVLPVQKAAIAGRGQKLGSLNLY